MMETLWQTQRRSTACGLLSGVFLVTAVVLSRRISGDASAFSSETAACITGVAASLIALLAASLPDLISDRLTRTQRTMLISACGLPGVMLGLTLMPPGSSTGFACLLGLYLAAILTVAAMDSGVVTILAGNADRPNAGLSKSSDESLESTLQRLTERTHERQPLDEKLVSQTSVVEDAVDSAELLPTESAALPFELNEPLPHPASNPETTQWMSRSSMDGLDVAEGAFRVRFAAGQRLAPVHLPFSPPLADTPEFECEPADDSDLRFRTTAVHAYGIRIEVSRPADCDEEATVEVAWMASAALRESAAA